MRRFGLLSLIGLALLALMAMSCGGPKEVVEEVPIDTTPAVVEEVVEEPPPPPPPPPTLKESQLQTVYFDFDKFALRADAKMALDANYMLMVEFTDAFVKIEGHCDERGTVEYNMSLGEKRAKAVKDYLIGRGITEGRLSIISYGKERPVDSQSTEDAWAKNRRGEFRIVSQ
jgi:peptidoglycan-associated lipoprotein